MAIVFGNSGVGLAGTNSTLVSYPTGINTGDLLALIIANKYPPNGPITPSGWTLVSNAQGSGGAGVAGAGTGPTIATVYTRVANGSELADVGVSVPSGNSTIGWMLRYTCSAGSSWLIAASNGADTSHDTSWSATMAADPGLVAGDMVLACAAVTSLVTGSAQAVAATGITTWGTVVERIESGAADGDDVGIIMSEHPVITGTSSAAPVFTMANSGNTTGATVLLRLREISHIGGGLLLVGIG